MKDKDRIIVVDSYPGSGKTSWAIQEIENSDQDQKIIYITPFLTEVQRVIDNCPSKEFVQPLRSRGEGSKLKHFLKLIIAGYNIVSTHALFSSIDDEIINALRLHNYTLYLDEVFQTVERFDFADTDKDLDKDSVTKQDVDTLIKKGFIRINENDYSVEWIDNIDMLSWYLPLKRLADRKLLYFVDGSLLLWTFPIEVFREGIFQNIYILTYQFSAQIQSYYYSYFNVPNSFYHIIKENNKYDIVKTSIKQENDKEWKKRIKSKIHILENSKLNNVGDVYYSADNHPYKTTLSLTWYENNPEMISVIKSNMTNYFINIAKGKSSTRLWTSFKEHRSKLKSPNVSVKYWIALNSRSTNEYNDKINLCYLINRYVDPFYNKFFIKKNISIDQDKYAVSELIQWIWRSAIRNGLDIYIYIPSRRMRELLESFLNDEELVF